MDIMDKRKIFFGISAALIAGSILALIFWGLKPSIDFAGGSVTEIRGTTNIVKVKEIAKKNKLENVAVITSGELLVIKSKEISDEKNRNFINDLKIAMPEIRENRFESVGPTISKTLTKNAFYTVTLASVFIIAYLAYAFRKVSKPLNSFEFGTLAVVALLHDVLIVVGVFSFLGHFFNIEIDSMFITALLTIIGFSFHDTIVVYDRIRERVIREGVGKFSSLVNKSILETIARSINTSVTVIFALLALYLFGGETTKNFVLALTIGIVVGTYSSIFIASALLVESFDFKNKRKAKNVKESAL